MEAPRQVFSTVDFRPMHLVSTPSTGEDGVSTEKRTKILHQASGSRFRITGATPTSERSRCGGGRVRVRLSGRNPEGTTQWTD